MEKLQLRICPNPKCQKSFETPIIISDKAKKPALSYYGCPNCLYELDPTSITILQKADNPKNEPIKQIPEEKQTKDCPKYLGYLHERQKDSIIPYECLNCTEMNKCILNSMKTK